MGHQFLNPSVVRGGSFNFQLPMGGGSSYFMTGIDTLVCQPAGEISLEKESSIQKLVFSEKYAVDQDLVVKYMHHLGYLNMSFCP